MKITNIYKKTAALFFLMAAALWPAVDAWGQVTGDRYQSNHSTQKIVTKPAKWHNLREQSGNRFVDDFSNDEKFFTYNNETLTYQAAHTIVDTLYVQKGSSVVLALPDRNGGIEKDDAETNIGSYQRWFNFRTGGVFNTSTTGDDDWRVVDLLTPTTYYYRDTYYRFQNGYVNRPLVGWNAYLPARMTFYYPTDDQFDSGYKPDDQTDNRYYLVACDLSGYMDFSVDGSTATFGTGGTYYEPTLTHRVIYYIVGVDGIWDRPLEEYEIDFPAYTLPNKSNEMVALSMDARSYLAGTNAISLTATISSDNTAGIGLVSGNNKDLLTTNTANSVTLTGDDRSIFFRMPNRNNTDGSRYVDNIDNNPTATINVYAGGTLVAKFKLNFKNESRLLTQSIVNDLNNGLVTQEATWKNLDYRTPESLTNEHILLTKLDFDYESSYAKRDLFYPYPLSWESNTYGFYDGSNGSDFTGGGVTSYYFPEYGSYSLLRSDRGYVESDHTWGWRNNVIGDFPPIIQNSEGNNSTYHLFVDASDRPGLIARLPFEENLCAGSVLYVSAWVKTARWDNNSDNAAVLFTIMGVSTGEDGKETFTPIHRYQTGQIPATYGNENMNTYKLNIDGLGDNEWMQAYFSFTNSSELSFDHYVLQVDNNSPSTQGGDIYLDDVRVYISKPLAEVKQLETACSTGRTLMNLNLDWDRLMARVGGENTTTTHNLAICFVDTLIFHNEYDGMNIEDAIEAAAVDLGQEGNSYHFRVLTYKTTFGSNTEYTNQEGGNLAVNNGDAFYGRAADETRSLSVDFYGAMMPGRAYWVLLVPDVPSTEISIININGKDIHIVSAGVFSDFYGNPCAINADFKVTGDVIIKVDGQIVTPKTEFCRGNINNFTVELQIPDLSTTDPDDMITITEGIYFDWFFGEARDGEIADPMTQYTEKVSMATGTPVAAEDGISLQEALVAFRNLYPGATALSTTDTPVSGDFTEEMYDLINYYLNLDPPVGAQNRPLVLHQPSLNITLLEALRVVVQPIPMSISMDNLPAGYDETKWASLCWGYTYLELTTTNAAPTVYPGFNTVTYPTDLSGQSLRIGLGQINSVKNGNSNTNTLTVDLRDAKSSKTTDPENPNTGFTLQLIGGNTNPDENYNKLFLTDTDDPDMKAFIDEQGTSFDNHSLPIGVVESFEAHYYGGGTTEEVNKMEVQFILDQQDVLINGENEKFTFKPREGYYYTFNVYFEEAASTGSSTACYGRFPLTMKVVPEYLIWNDVQKDDPSQPEDVTIGNWNYDGNWLRATNADIKATNTIDEYNNDNRAFVPMLFSKVVIPANSKIWLYQAGYGENGSWVNSDRPAEVADPTQNIQYDLMAFDHPINDTDFPGQLKTERYRVSLLNQIHFEPGAEMLHAEYLLYNKAWVDYQLGKGRWYTLASPLKAVYAGDFYTDSSTGTEGSEYFMEINFSTTDNDRFSPSVYQRGWMGNATLQTLNSGTKDVAISGNWSALTNDVAEKYEPGTGFSLKVQDVTNNATFRLPKADTQYSYYSQNGVQGSDNVSSISKVNAHRLQSDEIYQRTDNSTVGSIQVNEFTVPLGESADGQYYLVGNPFMAHLDMSAFFNNDVNGSVLEKKYWLVTNGNQTAAVGTGDGSWVTVDGSSTPKVAPLQSFFVQKAEGVTGDITLTFTQDMQTLGGTTDGLRSSNALTITATTSDGRTSRAAVAYDMAASVDYEVSEDAELFLDSNLGDVPMVYTVAGTMATSINRTSELYNIPLGVYGNKQEMVTLSFGGLNQFSSATLYDAQEQTETPLREGKTVSVPAGTSGRYFLRAGTPTGNEVIARNAFLVYSVGGGKVMVTSSNTPLKNIRVYTMGGAQVRSIQASGMQQEIYLNRGIYLITVSDQDGLQETKKVLVR